jgi:hypothetical protein
VSTASTDLLFTQLRNRLLSFAPMGGGATLNTRLGGVAAGSGRLWKDAVPDTAAYPFGVMRILNRVSENERERFDLEVVLYGRPRSQAVAIEDAADVADGALLNYRDPTSGLMHTHVRQRDTLPPPVDPADREIVQVRLVYTFHAYPILLSQYVTA